MPRLRSDEVIVLHPLIRLRKARDEPNNGVLKLKVIPSISLRVAFGKMDYIMLGESQVKMLIKSINTA